VIEYIELNKGERFSKVIAENKRKLDRLNADELLGYFDIEEDKGDFVLEQSQEVLINNMVESIQQLYTAYSKGKDVSGAIHRCLRASENYTK
jgi:hypothetical protein